MEFTLTPGILSVIAGVVLSLAFSYIPGLRKQFNRLNGTWKRLVMLCVLVVSTLAIYGLVCAGILTGLACNRAGAIDLAWAFVQAMIANQATFQISPKVKETPEPEAVIDMRDEA